MKNILSQKMENNQYNAMYDIDVERYKSKTYCSMLTAILFSDDFVW